MSYRDEHGGRDGRSTTDNLHLYGDGEGTGHGTETVTETEETTTEQKIEGTQTRKKKPKPGILERARRAMFGDKTLGDKTKIATTSFRAAGGFQGLISSLASPKRLAALLLGTGMGVFGILGIFTTYKNDDAIRNDPPIQCEPGAIVLPQAGGSGDENDPQEIVNIMYDILHNEFGYSEAAVKAIVACTLVETGCNPDRLESDYLAAMKGAKEAFDAVAGPGTAPTSDVAQQAYWSYGELFKTQGGWNGNPFYMSDGGRMCPGIGLIQWTAGRANNFIRGLDKISLNVSPMDTHYQVAYLIAEAQTSYQACAPDSEFAKMTDADEALRVFFGTMVYGNPNVQWGNEHLEKRKTALHTGLGGGSPSADSLVDNAVANSEFTMDAVTMAEELAEEGFNTSVAAAQSVQLCVNNSFIITSDIANAAVSISFLERGDYEDVQGAYGSYRRDARSPIIINDWDYIEGTNTKPDSLSKPTPTQKYSSRGVQGEPKKDWDLYDIDLVPDGKLDLIACTEYYYFAHLIAFPKETGEGGQAGYFSSCDRGTATAVRIAGADDKFPAGNPLYQLQWAAGGEKQGAEHNENARGNAGGDPRAGYLWSFAGFMRGSDYYSASGSPSISNGTVMISWSVQAANGLLGQSALSGATTSGMLGGVGEGETGDTASPPAAPATDPADTSYESKDASVKLAGLRWPMSSANTTRHIITYVGDATVQSFWGLDWLYQQFQLFDDCDRLVRKDLTEEIPEIMKNGLALKAEYAKKSSDQHMTFYYAQADGAQTHDDEKKFEPANNRMVEFNAKTGLPEFKAWEEIYIRLIHNSDDDATVESGKDDQLYEQAKAFGNGDGGDGSPGDGYLDLMEKQPVDAEIEQYDGVNQDEPVTYSNKYFFRDWNSLGIAKSTPSVAGDHKNDYKDPAVDGGGTENLIWYDKTDGNTTGTSTEPWLEAWTHERGAAGSAFWRYELVTDIEYRTNQFLRFGLASLMCSYPSEEDANVFQTKEPGSNDTGHILGNVYRRYSRIPDKVDSSGRYYYYNTVVSNEMLQDLLQLYSLEKNAYTEGQKYIVDAAAGALGKNERNYGPMYRIVSTGNYNAYKPAGISAWLDRRYGLTLFDINYIMDGIEGNKMGEAESDAVTDAFTHILTEPMHFMSAPQLSLYQNWVNARTAAVHSAHEASHQFNDPADDTVLPYETEIYGMNPFLMLEGEKLVNAVEEYSGEGADYIWEAGTKNGKSVRNDIEAELTGVSGGQGNKAKGVDATSTGGTMDDRLAWIDRHYFVTKSGGIGTFAYQVLALQPSAGSKMTSGGYESELQAVKTLKAGHQGQANADNLLGSKGLVQYTDYIYGETVQDNMQMAKRLFGKDDRNKDGATTVNGARDDYNRREFYVIPYYHTHAQQCNHSQLIGFPHYDLKCEWCNGNIGNKNTPTLDDGLTLGGPAKIDTQSMLNGKESLQAEYWNTALKSKCDHVYNDSTDYGDTISFNELHVINRGKYSTAQMLAMSEDQTIRYFADTGDEILWDAKPYIHVQCDGWTQPACCSGGSSCPDCKYCPGHGGDDDDDPWYCSGCVSYDCSSHTSLACPKCKANYCHACHKLLKCGETCPHGCGELLELGKADPALGCHPHKECDDWARESNEAKPCDCPHDTGLNHHKDGGTVLKDYQTDKCHYEYGCNALEYLYHNTEPDDDDGKRYHYRLSDPTDHTPQLMYYEGTMELFEVKAVYMVIPAAPGVDMNDFDIRDYITTTQFDHTYNNYQGKYKGSLDPWYGASGGSDFTADGYPWDNYAVVPDKCNLLQQVSYDENGWVENNWQAMIDGTTDGSLLKPKLTGEYYTSLQYMSAGNALHNSAITVGYHSQDDPNKGLLQYFTIEGNSIHRETNWADYVKKITDDYGDCAAEYIDKSEYNGTQHDLLALESIRNRVGYGKELAGQVINAQGATAITSQGNEPSATGSDPAELLIPYDNKWGGDSEIEAGDAAAVANGYDPNGGGLGNHGWGEILVTGAGHPMDPINSTAGGTGYGNCSPDMGGNPNVSGPDGSIGNNLNHFGNSLLREILGDEHVVHVKFDTQDLAGLTKQDAGDNGRDFVFYVDKKKAAEELGMDENDLKPKDYQSATSGYYEGHLAQFQSQANTYGLFKSMDKDVLYKNYYTGELTDKIFAENIPPYTATDDEFTQEGKAADGTPIYRSEPNKPNIPLKAVASYEQDQATNGGDSTGQLVISDKERDAASKSTTGFTPRQNTGDYRNWVTHASRGHRGMMTQYLNFGSFFRDVYANKSAAELNTNGEFAYMLFEVVMRSDIAEADDGFEDDYGNPMGSNDADKSSDWSMDGEPVTKNEGFIYRTAPGDATNTDPKFSWGYGDSYGFSDTYGQGSNSHWKNMIDLYNAAMSETRQYGY